MSSKNFSSFSAEFFKFFQLVISASDQILKFFQTLIFQIHTYSNHSYNYIYISIKHDTGYKLYYNKEEFVFEQS
jgi:hypothetical protein